MMISMVAVAVAGMIGGAWCRLQSSIQSITIAGPHKINTLATTSLVVVVLTSQGAKDVFHRVSNQ